MAKTELEAQREIISALRARVGTLEAENAQLKHKPSTTTARAEPTFIQDEYSAPPKGIMNAVLCGNTEAIAQYSHTDVSDDEEWRKFSRNLWLDRANRCRDPHIKMSALRQAEIEFHAGTEEYIYC